MLETFSFPNIGWKTKEKGHRLSPASIIAGAVVAMPIILDTFPKKEEKKKNEHVRIVSTTTPKLLPVAPELPKLKVKMFFSRININYNYFRSINT